jgi:hypothetical protein
MKKIFLMSIAALLCSNSALANPLIFTAIGDQPYFSDEAFNRLIKKINQDESSSFTIHVGDIKRGSNFCSDEYFLKIKKQFDHFEKPLIYTPGDNEWTDCHRANNGSYDQLERLNKLRSIFFTEKNSLGKSKIPLERQGDLMPAYAPYVENARWSMDDVYFITINQPGSNNNLQEDIPGAVAEYKDRNAANMIWLKNSFELAKKNHAQAIVLSMQSDIFDPRLPKESGFAEFIKTIALLSKTYPKPILMIEGDSHSYVVDQPIKDQNGQTINNLLRLIVPGANLVEAVQVKVDTKKNAVREVFSFKKYGFN